MSASDELKSIDAVEAGLVKQGEIIAMQAVEMGIAPQEMRDTNGNYPALTVFAALAQCKLAKAILMQPLAPMHSHGVTPGCTACGRLRPCNGPHDCAQM